MNSFEDLKTQSACPGADVLVRVASTVETTQQVQTPEGTVTKTAEYVQTFDFYSCQEAIKRLNDYLDSELDPNEREDVIRHLKVCSPCLERFSFEKNLISNLRDKVVSSVAPLKLRERLSSLLKDK